MVAVRALIAGGGPSPGGLRRVAGAGALALAAVHGRLDIGTFRRPAGVLLPTQLPIGLAPRAYSLVVADAPHLNRLFDGLGPIPDTAGGVPPASPPAPAGLGPVAVDLEGLTLAAADGAP